jgi:hypothetical protein
MLKKIYKSLKLHWKIKKIPLCWAFRLCGVRVPKSLQWIIGAFSGSGSGTSGDPYQITDWGELQEMNDYLDNTTVYFKLMNDLDSTTSDYDTYASSTANSGAGWLPIGNETNSFNGYFDGNGKSISNLFIDRTVDYVGLFGYCEFANFSDFQVSGDVTSTGIIVGGAFGMLWGCTATNISFEGDVSGGGNFAGGFSGYITASDASTSDSDIDKCYSNGTVSGASWSGGFSGNNRYITSLINDCYSTSSVTSTVDSDRRGGFVGGNSGVITNSYSTGVVSPTGGSLGGGFCGDNTGTITDCYWDENTSGWSTSSGGTGETTTQMQDINTFDPEWDIATLENYTTEIWKIDDGNDYPMLGWEEIPTTENTTNFFQFF